jgi:plastocyanin
MRRISIVFLMTVLAFAALSAPASAGGCVNETPPTAGTEPAVAIAKCQFTSGLLRVPVGTTVTWTNADFLPHEISGVGWGRTQSLLMPGDTFSHMFDRSGVYPYFCPLHPGMAAVVFVGDASTAAGDPQPSATKVEAAAPSPAEPATNGAWLATALLVSILVGVTSFAAGRYLGR